jgi:5-hydroxyisourate hydrolase-like protein (transthyretin family)
MGKRSGSLVILITLLVLGAPAAAADLAGRVINATTQKPASGDEVILFSLSADGMKETIRTQTDGSGRFTVLVADSQATYLLRVVHQGVTYDRTVQSGAKTIIADVYDVAAEVEGVTAIMDVERLEATHDRLEIKQLVTMRNVSKPLRTLMNSRPFEFLLPPEAQVKSGLIQMEDGQPLRSKPAAGAQRGEYYFRYPLRPGDTRFGIVYQLPYDGEAVLEPKIRNAGERFVIMLPKSMRFEPKVAGIFQPKLDVSPDDVQGTAPVTEGQMLAFRISGTGLLAELQGRQQEARSGQPQALRRAPTRRVSSVPENSIRSSSSLQGRDSFVLGGLTLALAGSTLWLYLKTRSARARAKMGTAVHSYQWQPPRGRRRVSVKFGRTT